ncbi:ribosome hibernation-promoting factor, HPF/YfiA family [Polynucleobacter rarus]|uniref:ribosome hibernation-promoting factor, HPF/YfiA family n=1 Tax=Polynucleobacter rarus TaxID=556055 RepID=UPI000D3E37AF|nr:ribosome-associated translation inhibitor RaiA [Polynucleobacter rarus]
MKVLINSNHLEVTPAINEHLAEKLSVIKKHFDQILQVSVTFFVEKAHEKELRQTCEISFHALGKDLFAQSHHADLYKAIDLTIDKLDKQILKSKEIVKNHHHPLCAKHISAGMD